MIANRHFFAPIVAVAFTPILFKSSSGQSVSSSSGHGPAGLLFIMDGPPLRVSDGATVELGGESWQATMLGDTGKSLKLSKWVTTNNTTARIRGSKDGPTLRMS
jgi:hypothetical protein